MAERLQRGCGARTISLGASDNDTHGSIEESWPCTVLEFAPSLNSDGGGILAFAGARNVVCRTTVGTCDQSPKLHSIRRYSGMAGNRSLAGPVERTEKCPLARHRRR